MRRNISEDAIKNSAIFVNLALKKLMLLLLTLQGKGRQGTKKSHNRQFDRTKQDRKGVRTLSKRELRIEGGNRSF